MRSALGALALIASMTAAANAAAAEVACGDRTAPWLRLELDGDGFGATLRARVVAQLALDLGAFGVAVCGSDGEPGVEGHPLGAMHLSFPRSATLTMELRDEVTRKRLSRDVPLASVPADARGLSIALAAEELLHASWIEVELAPPPQPPAAPAPIPRPVPRAVLASNEAVLARARAAPSARLALMAAADRATGGQTGFGGDARFMWGQRFTVGARFGVRAALDATSAHGAVRARELVVGLAGAAALVDRSRPLGAEVVAHVDAFDLQVSGVARPGAVASSGSALGVAATGGLGGWVRLGGPWLVVGEACAGAPLHGATASDSGVVALSVTGVLVGVAAGIGASF